MSLINSVINGVESNQITIEDRALHYADGLFETMLYNNNNIELWPEHVERLKKGCLKLALNNVDMNELSHDLKLLTKSCTNDSYIIKIIVTRGAAGRGVKLDPTIKPSRILLLYRYQAIHETSQKHLKICNTSLLMNRDLAGVKHLNRMVYVLAAQELTNNEDEGIMLNDQGNIIECINHNIFFANGNELLTPPIIDCGVAGIKRQQIIDLANKLNMALSIREIKINELKEMDECFITNAVVGLQSVGSIDDIIFKTQTFTNRIKQKLKADE